MNWFVIAYIAAVTFTVIVLNSDRRRHPPINRSAPWDDR